LGIVSDNYGRYEGVDGCMGAIDNQNGELVCKDN
jgi:hypothetical protein